MARLQYDPKTAAQALAGADPVLAEVIAQRGLCEIEADERVDLFKCLLRSIIYQQLHANAASAIHGRVLALVPRGHLTAGTFQRLSDLELRGAGLSANKLLALRDLAAKTLAGIVPNEKTLAALGDDELIAHLTTVRGIGPWTAQILMIFHLGRSDVLPTGDYAIRKAFSLLYRKGRKVTPETIIRHAKRWQPYRSVASWYLWRSLDMKP